MGYSRFRTEVLPHATVARLVPPPQGARYDGVELRDELTELARVQGSRILVVDFDDVQSYPAEVLACLAHARKSLLGQEPIRCVNMPLRLQFACRLLRLGASVLTEYDSLEEALGWGVPWGASRGRMIAAALEPILFSTSAAALLAGDSACDDRMTLVFIPSSRGTKA